MCQGVEPVKCGAVCHFTIGGFIAISSGFGGCLALEAHSAEPVAVLNAGWLIFAGFDCNGTVALRSSLFRDIVMHIQDLKEEHETVNLLPTYYQPTTNRLPT